MPNPLSPGLYDLLVTRGVERRLEETDATKLREALELADFPDVVARHIAGQVRSRLEELGEAERLELANRLLGLCAEAEAEVPAPTERLKAVYRGTATKPPLTPLSLHHLLTNSPSAPKLADELASEMRSADRVGMIVSFIQWRGWVRMQPAFEAAAGRGCRTRILTTTYMGATQMPALQALARLPGVEIRVSLDGTQRRLHAKAWLFERASGFGSAYVGSANLSGPALEDGIEWTVKLSQSATPEVVEIFRGAFESLWNAGDFEPFDPERPERVAEALRLARGAAGGEHRELRFFDLQPKAFQQATLDQLEAERRDRNSFRNLVVAPTGTGKTMLAAFDYARQPLAGGRPRLLYLAHRREILVQAARMFRHVLRDQDFGSVLAGDEPEQYDHLFATVQSAQSRGLVERFGADHWRMVILDEAHHVAAAGYRDLVAGLRPEILLGLTATPERADGESILPWFNHRIADEMRLWHAIERQYVVPFDYYGVADGTDLSGLAWRRGRYGDRELEELYVGNRSRAEVVLEHFCKLHGSPFEARALGFCASVAHAEFMAEYFRERGLRAEALTGDSPEGFRQQARTRLRQRAVNVLFTVDLFNEGVDIPEVDCVLFLRPTESATVFLQQLGRGLRLHSGKTHCLVLDFVGEQHRNFRFDLRYRAMLGSSRPDLRQAIETGLMPLPGNCYFRMDRQSREIVLRGLREQVGASAARMAEEVRELATRLQRRPRLAEYLQDSEREVEEVYRRDRSWDMLLHAAGLAEAPALLRPRLERLLHVDSPARLRLYSRLAAGEEKLDDLGEAERRMAGMLAERLRPGTESWTAELGLLRQSAEMREEFGELLEVLLDQVRVHGAEDGTSDGWPLYLHRHYTREEVLMAVGDWTEQRRPHSREGTYRLPHWKRELFFVTLEKNEQHFSPTTLYRDYAISPSLFHWQSQSNTGPETPRGRLYCEPSDWRFHLLVRRRRMEAYAYLGEVSMVSYHGSHPVNVTWRLKTPMPAGLYEPAAALATA